MAEKETKSCSDCIHFDVCYKIEHFGRDLETNIPCKEFIDVSDRAEVIRCKDCIYFDNGYIGHLFCRFFNSMPVSGMDYCKWGEQKEATSEKEVPVKRGHWIVQENWTSDDYYYTCSICNEDFYMIVGTPSDNNYKYCPNCGAKMRGETI